jgi:hypothetical protein
MLACLFAIVCPVAGAAVKVAAEDWEFIDNGAVRLGVIRSSGAGIAHFSRSGGPNVLDHYDRGRLMQQSYYGDADGSKWARQDWRYNPVQGGDYRGLGARVAELRTTASTLYARTVPRHWATGEEIGEMVFEQWITLEGDEARVRYRMEYRGERSHAARHQEIPALFVEPEYDTLVLYDGDHPWTDGALTRRQPGFPNEPARLSEHWAAWVDARGQGVGLYVPVATEATTYRYRGGGDSNCSYIAPVATFALTPGVVFDYDLVLALGSVEELRARFRAHHERRAAR